MTARPMSEEREPCPKLREAIENGHLRCSVSVGVGSPVATIDTEDLWRLVHAAERSLSTSAAVRGMREALRAAKTYLMDVSKDRSDAARGTLEIIDAALSSKGEG